MSSFDPQRQRRWQERRLISSAMPQPTFSGGFDDELVAAVVPPVTVVLEGRSICQRISLHKHGSYQSLARALRHMFVDIIGDNNNNYNNNNNSSSSSSCDHNNESNINLDLSNAVPGYLIAYEDMENDLLLVGDLNWKDFVRVAKRIRILPAKAKSRKQKEQVYSTLDVHGVAFILNEQKPDDGTPNINVWTYANKVSHHTILSTLSNELFDVYCPYKEARQIWESLVKKFTAEDAEQQKFAIGNYYHWQMTDEKEIKAQITEYYKLVEDL
ncbi:hypothetical protein BUALT_Bualt12G0060000 [Buddleja alternifolia]|uniref:Auxin-responsive protein n=1 Tax=Buddleja alternifolia TaxID=168488 RepID=A0AAV6WQA4_9LAMI|nr:hypothetical protein BUALT_Bualt12G0060000 [Buddleja alternifolia]